MMKSLQNAENSNRQKMWVEEILSSTPRMRMRSPRHREIEKAIRIELAGSLNKRALRVGCIIACLGHEASSHREETSLVIQASEEGVKREMCGLSRHSMRRMKWLDLACGRIPVRPMLPPPSHDSAGPLLPRPLSYVSLTRFTRPRFVKWSEEWLLYLS